MCIRDSNGIRFEPRLKGRAYVQRISRLVGGSFLAVDLNCLLYTSRCV